MKKEDIMRDIEDFVKENLAGFDTGHDWWHIDRVRQAAIFIHKAEGKGDPVITEAAALLHEIDDRKFIGSDKSEELPEKITELLGRLGFSEEETGKIIFIIRNISFSTGYSGTDIPDEYRIVQDADRLDAIGAIGIARTFNYGGFRGTPLHDPEGLQASTIKHFYDKLLKLKDMMNTETARKLACRRHRYMEEFLAEFYQEWNLEDVTMIAGQ